MIIAGQCNYFFFENELPLLAVVIAMMKYFPSIRYGDSIWHGGTDASYPGDADAVCAAGRPRSRHATDRPEGRERDMQGRWTRNFIRLSNMCSGATVFSTYKNKYSAKERL